MEIELIKLKKAVLEHLDWNMGICDCVVEIGADDETEMKINKWIEETLPVKKYGGIKYDESISSTHIFCWPMGELQPRIDWLDEQIQLLNETTNNLHPKSGSEPTG